MPRRKASPCPCRSAAAGPLVTRFVQVSNRRFVHVSIVLALPYLRDAMFTMTPCFGACRIRLRQANCDDARIRRLSVPLRRRKIDVKLLLDYVRKELQELLPVGGSAAIRAFRDEDDLNRTGLVQDAARAAIEQAPIGVHPPAAHMTCGRRLRMRS